MTSYDIFVFCYRFLEKTYARRIVWLSILWHEGVEPYLVFFDRCVGLVMVYWPLQYQEYTVILRPIWRNSVHRAWGRRLPPMGDEMLDVPSLPKRQWGVCALGRENVLFDRRLRGLLGMDVPQALPTPDVTEQAGYGEHARPQRDAVQALFARARAQCGTSTAPHTQPTRISPRIR